MEQHARSRLLKMPEMLGFSFPLMPELWSPFHVRVSEHACLWKFWKDPEQSKNALRPSRLKTHRFKTLVDALENTEMRI